MTGPIQLPASAITLKHGVPMTTSLVVAETFQKQHFNVLRDIDALDCSPEFAKLNFELADYIDKNGDPRRMFEMTRNGFVFLTMGYRGPKAGRFKEAYIARFDEMDAALRAGACSISPPPSGVRIVPDGRYIELLEAENALLKQWQAIAAEPAAWPDAPVKPAPRPVTDADRIEVLERYTSGQSRRAISKAMGRSHSTIRRILDLANAERAPQMALRLLDGGAS